MRSQWLWIMECFTEPVVVNHGVYCCASDFESRWVLLYQWLLIMVCIAEQVIVNHGEFYSASSCEWWCVMLSQCCELCCAMLVNDGELYWASDWIMICYAMPVVVSHGELCCARDVNHGVLCWASCSDSCVLYWTEKLWIMLFYTEPIVFELWCAMPSSWLWMIWVSGCELWCVLLDQWSWIMVCNAEQVIVIDCV